VLDIQLFDEYLGKYYLCYCSGLEKKGNCKGRPCNFKIDTFAAGKGQPSVVVTNPGGKSENVSGKTA